MCHKYLFLTAEKLNIGNRFLKDLGFPHNIDLSTTEFKILPSLNYVLDCKFASFLIAVSALRQKVCGDYANRCTN